MLSFPDNICSSNSQVSSNVSAHPAALQYKIVLSVLYSCSLKKKCYFFLWMVSVSLKHFRILADVLMFIINCISVNTNSNAKIAPHFYVIIVKLNKMIAANIWNLISSNNLLVVSTWINTTLYQLESSYNHNAMPWNDHLHFVNHYLNLWNFW